MARLRLSLLELLFCPLLCVSAKVGALAGPVVTTTYGDLQGFTIETAHKTKADIFLGIPFAKPPLDELRFEVSAVGKGGLSGGEGSVSGRVPPVGYGVASYVNQSK